MRRHLSKRCAKAPLAALLCALVAAGPALAAFPGQDPRESPRVNTPNDPNFDRCEGDDETTPAVRECTSYFEEDFGLLGFGPDSSTATYQDPSQLDAQGRAANVAAGSNPLAQISGVRADTAWKYSIGSPDVVVAILDTGIRWESKELVEKVRLNTAELPRPMGSTTYDANGDGRVTVSDYAGDPRVGPAAGDQESDELLDASDLIATFSNGSDADRNGYVDDIAGWDFFDDDNDPFDVSSCCSANNHGTGRAQEAVRATNDGAGSPALCPECQLMPLRVWDTFVVDTNRFALATVYATDNGASVVEGAVGGLSNTNFARRAFTYADSKGVTLTLVSSDLNTADHNYPTNYNEAIYVNGNLPDTAPSETCEGPGLPGVGGAPAPPGCAALLAAISQGSGGTVTPSTQPPTTSFFRNSNLTQYGGKADINLMGSTGSVNTGQAAGAAGLVQSFGRQRFAGQSQFPRTLSGNEVRQILTMSAEDVLPGNTGSIGLPDKARKGWDPHFGYGRVNLAAAMAMIQAGRIPPEAQLDAPDWFTPINVDRIGPEGVPIRGRVAAPHSAAGVGEWTVEYACGQDAPDSSFRPVPGASGRGARDGTLGALPKAVLEELADRCDGSIRDDAGLPAGGARNPFPADPYPDPDPHRHTFQIRLTVHEAADPTNIGVYRKSLHAYRNDGNLPGWPKPIGAGSVPEDLVTGSAGETPPRLFDLDGDNRLDILLGTSSGELFVYEANGSPLRFWNGGRPVLTEEYDVARAHARGGSIEGAPRESLRTPAIGDVTGDGEPDVIATAGDRLYGWARDGRPLPGFPLRGDPALSEPCKPGVPKPCLEPEGRLIDRKNHIKRGFIASPALADLNGDGRLDIVAGSLDQHVYAWEGTGRLLPGYPVELTTKDAEAGAEIVTSPAIADLDGDKKPEIVTATNEAIGSGAAAPEGPEDAFSAFFSGATGSSVVYALHADGKPVKGWPVTLGTIAGDVLPIVGPGHDAAILDVDRDGNDEVSVSATTADAKLVDGNGSTIRTYQSSGSAGNAADTSRQINFFEYSSVGDILGVGRPSVIKGGISLNGLVNLIAVNQNLPFNHTVQAWDPQAGTYVPGFPVATDDFQLLSQPAIAKVDASGAGRQALVGTGLYQLHAYGTGGAEPAGWPKFAGGWLFATPTVGDVDGDGRLDVVALTREGWSFVWRTDAPACSAGATTTNNEWWTFHHDERGTANYGTDARPPSRPGAPSVVRDSGGDVRIAFQASGDDLVCGRPARYEVRGSDRRIGSGQQFLAATRLEVEPASLVAAGERQELTAKGAGRFAHLAVRAVDDAGNPSLVGVDLERRPDGAGGLGSARRCVSRRARVSARGVGRLRLGRRRSLVTRAAGRPGSTRRGVYRYCVTGGGRVAVVFGRRGRSALITTTGRGHRAGRVGRGTSLRQVRRRFPRARRFTRSTLRASRTSRVLITVRRGRVRFVAVADRRTLRSPRTFRKYVRRSGL